MDGRIANYVRDDFASKRGGGEVTQQTPKDQSIAVAAKAVATTWIL